MFPSDLYDLIKKVCKQETRTTVLMLQGSPGVGKTNIIAQVAEELGLPLMTLALPTCEAVDLRGMPTVVDGKTVWASPMPKKGRGILLLDELSSAPPDVQVAAHHLVWSEHGSDMSVGEGWHIFLTGNRAQDKTLYRSLSAPLRNRMTLIPVEADPKQWADWAMNNQIDPNVIGFIRFRPNLLSVKDIPAEGAFPSPRAWHRASELLSMAVTPLVERELLTGTIGEGATTEFAAYLKTARDLPHIESIMKDQKKAKLVDTPAMKYAITTALAQYTREHQELALTYVDRLGAEFAMLYIRDVRDHYETFKTDKDVREWVKNHLNLFKKEDGDF